MYGKQYGFVINKSTANALVNVTDIIYCSINNDKNVIGIFIDLIKAPYTLKMVSK